MKILIIEDDNIWQLRLQMMLEKLGYTEFTFTDTTKQSIELLETYKPNLIIADIMLADSEVFGVFTQNKIAYTPIIFISAKATDKHLEKIKKLPNATLLEKPFGQLTLAATINNILPKGDEYHFLQENDYTIKSAKVVFDTINDTKLLDLLNFNEFDKKILSAKWFSLKSFNKIGEELGGVTGERIRMKYRAAIRKLKTKIQHNAKLLQEYQNFKSNKQQQLKQTNKDYLAIDTHNIHIDEVTEIPTKFRNILKEKGVTRIGQLSDYTFKQLSLFVHLGNGSAKIIQDAIAKFGVKLKE